MIIVADFLIIHRPTVCVEFRVTVRVTLTDVSEAVAALGSQKLGAENVLLPVLSLPFSFFRHPTLPVLVPLPHVGCAPIPASLVALWGVLGLSCESFFDILYCRGCVSMHFERKKIGSLHMLTQ